MRNDDHRRPPEQTPRETIAEIALVGDLNDDEPRIFEKLIEVEPGGSCIVYVDSGGGSPYVGLALMSLIRFRKLRVTAVVLGECSSAALWPFAACQRRWVFPHSMFLFHRIRWQSGENVELNEAAEWARHFGQLEGEMDDLLAQLFGVERSLIDQWNRPGRYLSGRELAEAGVAELVDVDHARYGLAIFEAGQRAKADRQKRRAKTAHLR